MPPTTAPKYALVSWPDAGLGVIPLADLDDAIAHRGALVIVREFEREPVTDFQNNPRADEGDD